MIDDGTIILFTNYEVNDMTVDVQVNETVVASLVEAQHRALTLQGSEVGPNWVEIQKSIWANALETGQCTIEELKAMLFKL